MELTVKDILEHSFVITIDKERYSLFKRIFKWHGLDKPYPRKFDGVTLWYNSPQYNCYLSHKAAIEKAKKLKWPYVCIFEDDAYPCVGVKEELERHLSNVPDDCAALALGWISMLSNNGVDGDFIRGARTYGAHAYIVFGNHYDDYLELLDNVKIADWTFSSDKSRELFFATGKNHFIQFNGKPGMNNSSGYNFLEVWKNVNGNTMLQTNRPVSEERAVEMGFPRISDVFPNETFNIPKIQKKEKNMKITSEGVLVQRTGAIRQGLLDFISKIDMKDMTMIEVGSYAGESSDMFASSGKINTLWCIDPWQTGYDENDLASSSNMEAAEKAFDKVVEKHPEIIHKYKGVLEGFIKDHPEVHPDLIYIDACHTYEGCKNDIINALKLNPKIISGHDYAGWLPDVIKAVDEVLGKPDMTFCDGSWFKNLTSC